jgi:hypothetical protein
MPTPMVELIAFWAERCKWRALIARQAGLIRGRVWSRLTPVGLMWASDRVLAAYYGSCIVLIMV